jgi:hypothetical protein
LQYVISIEYSFWTSILVVSLSFYLQAG